MCIRERSKEYIRRYCMRGVPNACNPAEVYARLRHCFLVYQVFRVLATLPHHCVFHLSLPLSLTHFNLSFRYTAWCFQQSSGGRSNALLLCFVRSYIVSMLRTHRASCMQLIRERKRAKKVCSALMLTDYCGGWNHVYIRGYLCTKCNSTIVCPSDFSPSIEQ